MIRPTAGGLCDQVRPCSLVWHSLGTDLPFALVQAEARDTWQYRLMVGLRICTGPALCLAKPGAFPPSSAQHSDGQDL